MTDQIEARPLRLLVVDDHEVVRQGLVSLLERREHFQVVAEAGTAAEAVEMARKFEPDLVVMDVRLPDGSGIEACREIRAEFPSTRVVILTSYPDEEAVLSAIIAGASGYLLKQIRGRDLVSALESVGRGESLLDPAVTEKVLDRVRRIATGTYTDEMAQLTQQEQKILLLVAEGKTNKEIASEVFLSDKTVKNYVSSILSKLNLERRAQAAAFVARHRLKGGAVPPGPSWPAAGRSARPGRPVPIARPFGPRRSRPAPKLRLMRIVSADEAVSGIKSGQQIFMQGSAAMPEILLEALVARAPELRGRERSSTCTSRGRLRISPPRWRATSATAPCSSVPNARPAVNDGRAEYIPVFLSEIPLLFDRAQSCPLDACLHQREPRRTSTASARWAPSVDTVIAAIRCSKTVIAQLNRSMPRTLGDSFVHVNKIDFGVEVDMPPYEHADPEIGDVERRIGEYVADLVQDEATLQMGIGAIPSAVCLFLDDKKDLGHPHRDVHGRARRPGRARRS